MIFLIVCAVIFGLIIGSFLNVCIYRIPEGMNIAYPPSFCPSCRHNLGFFDLFPVLSAVLLGFKCRYCGHKFSKNDTLIELLTGIIFGLLIYRFGFTVEFFAYAFLMSLLIIVFFIDLRLHIIPGSLVWTGSIAGALLFVYHLFKPVELYGDRVWWNPLLGMVCCSGILYLISVIGSFVYKTDEAMGLGDVYIYIPIGLFLGWKMALISLLFAIIIGAAAGAFLIALKKKDRGDGIPFGPSIVAGVFITILWGQQILNWYLSLLSIG